MGVKACDRYDCERIMCDRYSNKYGYICQSCFDELVARKPKSAKEVQEFMESSTDDGLFEKEVNYLEVVDKIFPCPWENED